MKKIIMIVLICSVVQTGWSQVGHSTKKPKIRAFIQHLNWSPDGNQILFSAIIGKSDWSDFKSEQWNLYELHVKSKNIIKIADRALWGAYSPDRRELVYSKYFDNGWEIVSDNIATGNIKQLTFNKSNDSNPSFSPDGMTILFSSDRDNVQEIYQMSRNGKDQRRITFSEGAKAFNAEWSNDGTSIVYYIDTGDKKDQIYTMNLFDLTPVNRTNNDENNMFPAWISNSGLVYCGKDASGTSKVYRKNIVTLEKQQIGALESYYARFSPDGYKVAFVSQNADGECTVSIANMEGTEVTPAYDYKRFMEMFGPKR